MEITKEELEKIINHWEHEFIKLRGVFWLYESIFKVKNSEEAECRNSIFKGCKNFFVFTKEALLDSMIINLEKFFQKSSKKYQNYFFIKEKIEDNYNLDCSGFESKYENIKESVNTISTYRNNSLAHFPHKRKEATLNISDLKRPIDFVLEFLNFISLHVYERENDYGKFAIKRLLKLETDYIFEKLHKKKNSHSKYQP